MAIAAPSGGRGISSFNHLIGTGSKAIRSPATSAYNTIEGRAGGDFINGDGGDDVLIGGEGGDIIVGGEGKDWTTLLRFRQRA